MIFAALHESACATKGRAEMSAICPVSDQKQTYRYVRFTPESGHRAEMPACPLSATSGCEHSQQTNSLFDHLVGEGDQTYPAHGGQHFGDLAVYHELEVHLASG